MPAHHTLDYLELASTDLEASKAFFVAAFAWTFTDYGPDYAAFAGAGLDGGLFRADRVVTASEGGVLPVLYSDALEDSLAAVVAAGARIHKPIFAFPGGRRFHFIEPGGNELAVWSAR